MNRKLAILVVLLALFAVPAAARAGLPPGFIGVSPQSPNNARDFELMRKAGVDSVRLPMNWSGIETKSPLTTDPDWSAWDKQVEMAAESGLRVLPFIAGSPEWVAPEQLDLPVNTAWQRSSWTRFLREVANRYGPEGIFWREHRKLAYLPMTKWEIWNEENIVSYTNEPNPEEFAVLIRISGRALHQAAPGTKVIIGGLFGRPLQIPPNIASGDFLNRIYAAGNVKPYFDGVGLHPYVADAKAMGAQLRNLRRIMRAHHDGHTPIYITELGWGSASGPTRWQRGLYGQADELSKSFELLSINRHRWNVAGAWWFTWSDEGGTCIFCGSAGLLTEERKAKPAWYRFNAWTGGDPDTVPKLGGKEETEEEKDKEGVAEPETEIRP
jgi:hypothetical protein